MKEVELETPSKESVSPQRKPKSQKSCATRARLYPKNPMALKRFMVHIPWWYFDKELVDGPIVSGSFVP